MNADDLGRARGIVRAELVRRSDTLAADEELVFAAELRAYFVERLLDGTAILRDREIGV